MLPVADFGTDTTAAGWLTLVLPLFVLLVVFAVWYRMFKARVGSSAHSERTPPPAAPRSEPPAVQIVAPLVPAALLPIPLALAVAALVALLWWRSVRRARA